MLFTKTEAAEYAKVSRVAIYKWIEAGKIPSYLLGKRKVTLVSPRDIDEFRKKKELSLAEKV